MQRTTTLYLPTPAPPYTHLKQRPQCVFCHYDLEKDPSPYNLAMFPYLIHKRRPALVNLCHCPQRAHVVCMARCAATATVCEKCQYIYRSRRRIWFARLVCLGIHLLSLGSVIGLVFGLAYLGSALDRLGLGKEAGTKLDGDENWQDQELQQILAWLQLVHFATGAAGEALLGLVYLIGVCGIIGLHRTLRMIDNILHVNLEPLLSIRTTCVRRFFVCAAMSLVGLTFGTYLLFYSWIWACLFQHVCHRILDIDA